jgi:alpha-methylacyl-CoA racemase
VSAPAKAPTGALAGIRIVEFAGIGPGPFAAMLLADMGAEIVRIDRPGGADHYSGGAVARGRRTVVVNLKDPAETHGVLELLDRADALIEGFRPGVMERLGLGPDVVLKRNPRLVYGRMTGWGQTGPLAKTAGHDINYIAIAGALAAIGPESHPVPPLNLVGDYGGGSLYLVAGLLAGLIAAQRTGAGQVIDAAICDGTASLMSIVTDLSASGHYSERRQANMIDGGAPYYRTFPCADGKHVAIGALEPQFYALLCKTIGLEDGEFKTREDKSSWPGLHEKFEAIFKTRTRDEWTALLEGTDACYAPVMTLSEAPAHPHLAARETFVEVDGRMQPAPAPRFSRTPSAIRPADRTPIAMATALEDWARP